MRVEGYSWDGEMIFSTFYFLFWLEMLKLDLKFR